ncbi:MAG: phenylalanine--tRNA ligase subunit beta [Ignavibacteria bacterium]|nr:phenylalanine--tRNA ligase subunit beta [Ignavibacteria bacterium]
MRISFNLLKEFVDLPKTPKEIASILTSIGFEVEEYFDFGEKYQNFVVAEVTSCEKVTEKLSYCSVFDGKETHKVICGAPNVAINQKVVLALPGAVIPKSGLVIKPTTIRGYESSGMICSEDELEIGDCSTEIFVLDNNAPIGTSFSDYYGLNDVVFEIGITPNRGDCLSHLGIARELAAFFMLPLKVPSVEPKEDFSTTIQEFVNIEILDKEKCPRYSARIIKNITVQESPNWLKSRLILLGLRPINCVVDVTNYVMMELGQPLHAFDYDKLAQKRIIVRTANNGEEFVTLDGKKRELDDTMLMICDAEKPVAIGGVMGGENSEISFETKNVLLESAFFNPVSIRRTTKKLGISSESSYRFERGVDYENVVFALNRASQLIALLSKGELVAGYIDIYPNKIPRKYVSFRFERARKVLGADIKEEKMKEILVSLGFKEEGKNAEKLIFEVPSFRFDVEQEIDLIEDIARFYGYDNIPEDRSYSVTFSGETKETPLLVPKLRNELKSYFVSRGFTEILTQNLYSPKKTSKFFEGETIEIANPLGEEYSIVRPSILPSILEIVKLNMNIGKKDLKLFEIGKEFRKNENSRKFIEGIEEREVLAGTLSGLCFPLQWGYPQREVDFFDVKGMVEHLLFTLGINEFEIEYDNQGNKVFGSEYGKIKINGALLGEFGVIAEEIKKFLDLQSVVYIFYINLEAIYNRRKELSKFSKISPFPVVRRDLAFVVDEQVSALTLQKVIRENGGENLREVILFDVYRGKNIGEGKKNLAFALFFNSYERTLTDEEVQDWINRIIERVSSEVGAEHRVF